MPTPFDVSMHELRRLAAEAAERAGKAADEADILPAGLLRSARARLAGKIRRRLLGGDGRLRAIGSRHRILRTSKSARLGKKIA